MQTKSPLKNQRGVAILLALFTFVLVSALAMELLEETQVEYISASQSMHQLKSYYAAKSGVELSLLRVLMYKKARHLAGSSLGPNASLLDKIWQFPFIWPPQLPEQATIVDQQLLNDTLEETLLSTPFATTIAAEGSKIDINALGSKSKILAENSKTLLLQLFQNKMDSDESFGRRYRGFNFEELLNHIADWVDEDSESRVGGGESNHYRGNISDGTNNLPPNQPFKTMEELHMVEGMTDDLFEFLVPHITIYGIAGINVNQADKNILMSIDPGITSEVADEIIKRRNDPEEEGPFAKLEDFISFLEGKGLTLDQEKLKKEGIPLLFEESLNFRITSTATVGNTSREIVAVVYDFDRVKERLKDVLSKEKEDENNKDTSSDDNNNNDNANKCEDKEGEEKYECLCQDEADDEERQDCIEEERKKDEDGDNEDSKKKKAPQGRPNVVYWFER